MSFFKKILFPVDLSEASKKIVPYVREAMEKFDAEVHLLYVAHVTQYYSSLDMPAAYIGDIESEIRGGAEKKLQTFKETFFKDLPVHVKIISGRPGPEIVRYAKSAELDWIIMGHSSTGIERAVFGSVAGYAVKYSHVPVLIISPVILEDREVKKNKEDENEEEPNM
jgi:nucleotide-binding universal stress UspA family protein